MRDRQKGLAAFAVASLCAAAVGAVAAEELTGAAAYGDWRADAPGVRRKITAADMPAPFATGSARETARVIGPPGGAHLSAPSGFAVSLFADRLQAPRAIRVAPNGDIFIAESQAGRVRVLRGTEKAVFASGLDSPFGIAFYPPGPDP